MQANNGGVRKESQSTESHGRSHNNGKRDGQVDATRSDS